jgi:hypothetical protein
MNDVLVALITASSLISVGYMQFVYRSGKKRGQEAKLSQALAEQRWVNNKADHDYVVTLLNMTNKNIDTMGKNLGRSIDRVEKQVDNNYDQINVISEKLDQHLLNHKEVK